MLDALRDPPRVSLTRVRKKHPRVLSRRVLLTRRRTCATSRCSYVAPPLQHARLERGLIDAVRELLRLEAEARVFPVRRATLALSFPQKVPRVQLYPGLIAPHLRIARTPGPSPSRTRTSSPDGSRRTRPARNYGRIPPDPPRPAAARWPRARRTLEGRTPGPIHRPRSPRGDEIGVRAGVSTRTERSRCVP